MLMRTVAEHRSTVLAATRVLESELRAVSAASGRTLAAPVVAAVDLPPWDNSAMDGFAVRYDDVASASATAPATVRVVADLAAGSSADPVMEQGQAARIMTGAPLPSSADTVVPFEATAGGLKASLESATVVAAPRFRGAHVRRRAEDAATGDLVLDAGERLGSLQLAAAAAAGVAHVRVTRAPRVAVLSTGDELRGPGQALRRGEIPESNSILLGALVAEADAEVVFSGTVSDDEAAFLRALDRARESAADVVVTSGGVSAGAFEVVRTALGGRAEVSFGSVAIQPGRPQGFGLLPDGALFFGLPGNPVGAAVSFEAFVRPALLRLQGRAELDRPVIRLPAASGWRTARGRRQYVPVRIDRTDPRGWTVRPVTEGDSGAHRTGALGRAAAYAVVEPGTPDIAPGHLVDVLLLT